MACFHPLRAFRTAGGHVVFNELARNGDIVREIELPCGRCIGCRLERSRQWAIRCMHEGSMYDENCFLTLTYDDDHLPHDYSLNYRHFQLFMKRLRVKYPGRKIRFFMCGEYGDSTSRPHYHAILFNFNFADRKPLKPLDASCKLTSSRELETLWPFGLSSIGELTFHSAAYVARYVLKKVTGDSAAAHYRIVDEYGELHDREPEFMHCSLKPGIGQPWLDKWKTDVYPHDYVVVNGKKVKPPKYYDRKMMKLDEGEWSEILANREFDAYGRRDDSTPERLAVREAVASGRTKLFRRSI